jgi:ATP-binding cassette subfamily B protein
MFPAMTLVMNGVSILIVWIASKQIDLGKLQVGSMTAFITYAMMIIMSFLMLTMISVFLPRAAVAAERVDEVLSSEGTIKDKEDADPDKKITQGVVRFEHVNFRYNNADADVLEDIDFTAQKGKTTAIIGSTGSGKSTLVHLIPRFYDVTAGKITIDGVDVRDYTQENLREAIGFVPQKGVLFSGDIDSNLAFGCPDAPHEQLEKAAQIAQATEFITAKPDGFKSEISQGGTNVSGGQKQRLSIARAIAKKPKVLIFDDSFSALDFKTDVALRKALGENVTDATIIIVAQRIVTIMNADEIIVLDDGRIAGKGTHLELIGNCEVYDQIVKSQLSEEEYKKQLALAGRKGDE